MRKQFEENTAELKERCIERLGQLEADLELRRKVHIHEIEERKNLHISDLMKNHDKAFGQMKSYYNDITNDNLKLIKDLKVRVSAQNYHVNANSSPPDSVGASCAALLSQLTLTIIQLSMPSPVIPTFA